MEAKVEARNLLILLKRGETPDSIRRLIGDANSDRLQVRMCFDALVFHRRPPQEKAKFEKQVAELLQKGHTQKAIRCWLPVSNNFIRAVSKKCRATTGLRRRGRRFSPEEKEKILAAVRSGARAVDLMRDFHISRDCALQLRHAIGDREDRRQRHSWDTEAVRRALLSGMQIGEIERTQKIQHSVLWKFRHRLGDHEDRRRRKRCILSDAQRAAILDDIRAGLSQRAIARKHHLHASRVRVLQVEIGMPPRYHRRCATCDVEKIRAGFESGKSDSEIAQELGFTRGAIQHRRKQERQQVN